MFSVATGKLVQAWDPAVATRVKAIAIFGNSVFFGGSFGRVDNTTRNRLAAVRLIQGDLLPWNPNADDEVYAIDLSDNGTRVFIGGPFRRINNKDHYSLAMTNNTTGAAYSMPAAAAIPKPNASCTTRVKTIDTLGNKVFVGNGGDGSGCYDGVLAADATTGALLWQNKCLGATEAVKAIGNWVYKGSHAHNCSLERRLPRRHRYALPAGGERYRRQDRALVPEHGRQPEQHHQGRPAGVRVRWQRPVGRRRLPARQRDGPAGLDPVHQRRGGRGAGGTEGTGSVEHGGQPGLRQLQGQLRPRTT